MAAAHADSSSILYVDGSSSACTDSGTGTQAAPYCTIQPAANAAVAGDTVDIEAGTYTGDLDVTSTGTAVAPIVFQTVGHVSITSATGQGAPVLSFDGASYVSFEGGLDTSDDVSNMQVQSTVVSGSAHITLDQLKVQTIEVTGTSSDVTVSRDWFDDGGVTLDAGGSGDIVSTNWFDGGYIAVDDAADTAVTSNTVEANSSTTEAIGISGASTGVTVENNIVEYSALVPADSVDIAVDAAAVAGTTADYNVVWPYAAEGAGVVLLYAWAGVDYNSAASLYAATGQGKHDSNANPWLNPPPFNGISAAPQTNSANSAAPGMLDTDMYGAPCTGDPIVPVTGTGTPAYCARGAVQPVYTTTVAAAATQVSALRASLSSAMSQTFSVGTAQQYRMSINTPPSVSYAVNWGDGTTETYAGSTTTTNTTESHAYAKVGTYTITDTANLSTGSTVSTTTSFTTAGSDYTPITPTRIVDTRQGIGTAVKAKVGSGDVVGVKVAGVGSIPSDVTALALNLTATDTTAGGYLLVSSDGTSEPGSTLNYGKGQTIANSAIVSVAGGSVYIYNGGTAGVDVLADVYGYFTPTSASQYTPVTANRLLDTRNGTGAAKAKIAADSSVAVTVAGQDSIPAGVTAAAVHITVTDTTGGGWIAGEADGAGTPTTSSLNYGTGQTISNTVIVPVASDGKIELYNGATSGSVDLVADVTGYFSTASANAYVPLPVPIRAWDSRADGEPLTPGGTGTYLLTADSSEGVTDYPAAATMVTNITVTNVSGGGYVTAYPADTARPGVSNLNYLAGQTVATMSLLATTGVDQEISVYNGSGGSGDIILDVTGYFAHS